MYVLIYHLTYICPSLFGWKENILYKQHIEHWSIDVNIEIPQSQTGQKLGLKTEKAREAAEAIIRSEKRSRLLNSRVEL